MKRLDRQLHSIGNEHAASISSSLKEGESNSHYTRMMNAESMLSSWDLKKLPTRISASEVKFQFSNPFTLKEAPSQEKRRNPISKLKRSKSNSDKLICYWDSKKAIHKKKKKINSLLDLRLSRKLRHSEKTDDGGQLNWSSKSVGMNSISDKLGIGKCEGNMTILEEAKGLGEDSKSNVGDILVKDNNLRSNYAASFEKVASWDLMKIPIKLTSEGVKYTYRYPYSRKEESSSALSPNFKQKPFPKKSEGKKYVPVRLAAYWDLEKVPTKTPGGEFVYKACPSLTETQQCVMEYSLPLVLPGIFYVQSLSPFGLNFCFAIVAVHTLETLLTDFGKTASSLCACSVISPLAHYLIDCFWLHSLITTMLLVPQRFVANDTDDVRKVIYTAFLLIQTIPIYLSVCFKSNYANYQQYDQNKSAEKIGFLIVHCFIWFWISTYFIAISSFAGQKNLLKASILMLNVLPLALTGWYYQNVSSKKPNKAKV